MMVERRRHSRHPAIFGSEINSNESAVEFGLTQDVSLSGARLLTLASCDVGHTLLLLIVAEGVETERKAKVVRVERVEDRGMWRYQIGVEFTTPLTESLVRKLKQAGA